MFHLLVKYKGWGATSDELTKDRVFEYTADHIRELFSSFETRLLQETPAVFLTEKEGTGAPGVRSGRITDVVATGSVVRLNYVLDPEPLMTIEEFEAILSELGVEPFELFRSHWAVKEADLYQVLQRHMPRPAIAEAPVHGSLETLRDIDKKAVFLIHGRNMKAVSEVQVFLRACGLSPLLFDDLRASLGGTPTIADIVTEGMARAQGIVALFTPDESATLREELRRMHDKDSDLNRLQSRPNVLFEAGMAFGRDRRRIVFVSIGRPELFTDVAGVHVIHLDGGDSGVRHTLRQTLRAMGCAIEESAAWLTAGNFDSAMPQFTAPAPELRTPSERDAHILVDGWLSSLEPHEFRKPFRIDDIARTVAVSPEQLRSVLTAAVTRDIRLGSIEFGDEVFRLRTQWD